MEKPTNNPQVGIVMGSDSDLPVMQEAAKILELFGVANEITVISAHRTPDRASDYARSAADRGLKVIIAGAGGAAHLPGVLAAYTPLPVIGLPIKTAALNGVDSLYSIVQMPSGIPVATVGINGARNAGLLAIQILSLAEPALRQKMIAYRETLAAEVEQKAKTLSSQGYQEYLKGLER